VTRIRTATATSPVQLAAESGTTGRVDSGLGLSGVTETLLITLYARHLETLREDAIVYDRQATEIVERLGGEAFSKFAGMWSEQVGVATRTEILDEATRAFLRREPNAIVVNLGAGLCTRFCRVGEAASRWIDIDVEAVAPLWHELQPRDPRRTFVGGSVLDSSWTGVLDGMNPDHVLFIAEGLLMYLEHEEVGALLRQLGRRFPGAHLLFDVVGPVFAASSRVSGAVARTGSRYRWGIRSLKRLEQLDESIRVEEEWAYLGRHPHRWRWLRVLRYVPGLRNELKVGRVRFVPVSGPARA
jgi:O-methyltransferase involved in polyketide biosynthesis